jgi:acyl-coenzyme A synthetase/AMP-(fatty) acid ligase
MSFNLATMLRESDKYPREVRIVDELPKGPTGKILKKELRV